MSILLLKNLSKVFKTYSGDFYALKNISLSLGSTGLVSIVGKSGSGKSTLLNLLLGIDRPSTGEIIFNHKNISKMSDRVFSKYHLSDVSMVFQHYNVFLDLSAKENIMLPLLMRGEPKKKIEDRVNNLLNEFSLSSLANRKCKSMSGGEKQRIAILRAIITSPKMLLCDEPTGALDRENSQIIMQILKKLSKIMLVIMVSHNKDLVNQYSDKILTLKDGELVEEKIVNDCYERNVLPSKSSYSSKWTKLFTRANLKLNKKKDIFSTIACTIGFASIFLSFGFYEGSQASQNNALKNNLSVLHASASEKKYFDIANSPLSYEKSIRPSNELLKKNLSGFNSVVYGTNLSYLFPPYPYGTYLDKNIDNFQLVPLYDVSLSSFGLDLIVEGEPPNEKLTEVIVNEEFIKLLGINNEEAIDDLFNISYSTTISYPTYDYENPFIKDEFSFDFDLRIAAVVKEFSFLNTPKIYYSYPALKREFETLYLENISEYLGEPLTIYEYIESVKEDDPISSYSTEIFLTSNEDVDLFFNKVKELKDDESVFQIESSAYDIKDSYKTFIESFSTALFVFVIIAFIGVNFILGMISLSTYIENKKNSAILTCLGARSTSIQSIYLSENYLIVFVSMILSIGLSILIQKILNSIISSSFALDNLIKIPFMSFLNVPFALPILLTFIALLFSTIFTLVPMSIYRHISLADELRDE